MEVLARHGQKNEKDALDVFDRWHAERRFDREKAKKDVTLAGLPQLPCGMECGRTFATLNQTVHHVWADDLLSLGHCTGWQYEKLPTCPMHLDHKVCPLALAVTGDYREWKRLQPEDGNGQHLHVNRQFHVFAGHGILCTCGYIFPTIYHACRHFLRQPSRATAGKGLKKNTNAHIVIDPTHQLSLATYTDSFRSRQVSSPFSGKANARCGFTLRPGVDLGTY